MKPKHRLDYNRLAEALGERGLIDPESLQHVLHQCLGSKLLFPEILVNENMISDWEISRVVSEVFNLPFLTPQVYAPSEKALDGVEKELLHQHGFIPLDRFGKVVTVAMPALTPSDMLNDFARTHGIEIIPVVSTVLSNRTWLYDNMQVQDAAPPPQPAAQEAPTLDEVESALPQEALDDDWANLFDEGDAAVLMDLEVEPGASDVDLDIDEPGPAIPDPPPAAQPEVSHTDDDGGLPGLPELPKLD